MLNDIDRAKAALNAIPSNFPRDEWHEVGRSAIAAGLSIEDIDNWSKSAPNYKGRADVEAAFNTIKQDGGTGAGTLFYKARQYGYNARSSSAIVKPSLNPVKLVKQVAGDVVAVWERCVPAALSEAYIDSKQGKPDGLRVYPVSAEQLVIMKQNVAGYLVVPCWSDGVLQTLQFIPPTNKDDKLNMYGSSFGEGFFTVGEITDCVYIVEGIGQAWAANKATGKAAVVTFGSGRMAKVAKVLRDKFPTISLIIVPDKGMEDKAAEIAAEISGQWIAMPADKPSNYDANDYLLEHGTGALADLLERVQAPAMRYKLLSDDDLAKLPPLRWLIKKVLPETGLAAIYGASGSGKSFLVLDALQSLTAGRAWFDYTTKPCNVLYCALEGEGGIAGRVAAYRIHHGSTSPNIRYLVQPFSLLEKADIDDLAKAIKANRQKAKVVVLDTLNRATPGADENDSKSMSHIINGAKKLQELIGGLIILVHHTGKDVSKGLRGHSSLHAALDAAIEVRRDGDRRHWTVTKNKDGADGNTCQFKLSDINLGMDEDDEPITSCVVVPDDTPVPEKGNKPLGKGRLPESAKIGLKALEWALKNKGVAPPPEVLIETGTGYFDQVDAVTSLDEWRSKFKTTIGADNKVAERQSFGRAKKYLIENNIISIINKLVYIKKIPISRDVTS